MSMQSVDTFETSSSTAVFGSAVSQTKLQQQPSNDAETTEKLETPPAVVLNGQNDTTSNKRSDNVGTDNTESTSEIAVAKGAIEVHVNGQNEKSTVDTVSTVDSTNKDTVTAAEETASTATTAPKPVEKTSEEETALATSAESTDNATSTITTSSTDAPVSAPTIEPEPEPAAELAKTDLSSTATTNVDSAPATEQTATSDDNVATAGPEATVAADSATPERKGKSTRGKPKSPIVPTPPTRHSTRARKPVTTTSNDEDDEQLAEEVRAPAPSQKTPTPQRGRRQAATQAKDAKETTSTPGDAPTEEFKAPTEEVKVPAEKEQDKIPAEAKTPNKTSPTRKDTRASANTGKKREASSSPPVSASKKTKASPRGKKSITSNDDEQKMDTEAATATTTTTTTPTKANETVQTPTKKARTSANKKTPTSKTPESSDEYLRKLRPRK